MRDRNLVIIPTYQEKENISDILEAIFDLEIPFDILVVDDNSPDGTALIVQEKQSTHKKNLHLIQRTRKMGLGSAYLAGFSYALKNGYDYIYEMDADFSHDPKDLMKLHHSCKIEGNDMAIGSRYIDGVNVVNWPIDRVLMSYGASLYVRLLTGMPIYDTTAGFKCYHHSVLRTINLKNIKFTGYAFQIEMKFNAWKYGFKIKEVSIIFTDRKKGESKMSAGIFTEAIFGVLQLKIMSLFNKYEPGYSIEADRINSLDSVYH